MNDLLITLGTLVVSLGTVKGNAVRAEHLAFLQEQLAVAKELATKITEERDRLLIQNNDLNKQLQQLQLTVSKQSETGPADTCPYCRRNQGQLLRIAPHPIAGEIGLKIAYYRCDGCSKEYDRELPLEN